MPDFREIRDPIHGFIRVTGTESDIVDTPVFQRLRPSSNSPWCTWCTQARSTLDSSTLSG